MPLMGTSRADRAARGPTVTRPAAVLAGCGVFLLVAWVASASADGAHGLVRDPISYFGADAAPYPGLVNLAIGATGIAMIAWALSRWSSWPRPATVLVGIVGASSVLLALFPIDCSPADGLCAALIRARAVTVSHDVHSIAALILFAAMSTIAVTAAGRAFVAAPGPAGRLGAVAWMILGVAGTVLLVVRPFGRGAGMVQIMAIVVAALSLKSWVSTTA